jgi:uncharacterized protein
MNPYEDYLNDLINQNNQEYKDYNGQIKWVNNYNSLDLESKRNELINNIQNLNWSFNKTKPWINLLSEGCQLCGKGEWSCLFITNKCNASCFFCPTQQLNDESPATQSFTFDDPQDYVSYIKKMNFKGVSISGGEPLLFFEKTMSFLNAIQNEFGNSIYKWLYTNGILGKEVHYKRLAEAGLNEIRFDLAASNYNINIIKLAIPYIEIITVEIPAIPEDLEKLKALIPQLIELKVSNLNLHQMRLTTYNAPHLLKRNYTFLHGERVTVMESEIAALEILNFTNKNKLAIGINYCSYHFKNRFQKSGYRTKVAKLFMEENEEITENGYLRTIQARLGLQIDSQYLSFKQLIKERNNITEISVRYRSIKLSDSINSENSEKQYFIENKVYCKSNEQYGKPFILVEKQIDNYIEMVSQSNSIIQENDILYEIDYFERIEVGLREYF